LLLWASSIAELNANWNSKEVFPLQKKNTEQIRKKKKQRERERSGSVNTRKEDQREA
jgi:hypothetical protein